VLLLDEPTSHLDLNHALQVLDLVRSLADGGIAVLGVFHDLGIAARYADRMSIVADGRLTPSAPPAEALSSRVISDVFGVRAVVRTDPVTGSVAVTPVLRGEDLTSDGSRGTVGLVCGSGTGIALMRDLMRTGYDVAAGALNRGDVDQAVAEALGVRHAALPPFGEIDADAQEAVRRAYADARCVVVCPTPFGRSNLPNLRAAFESGRPLVLVGDMTPDRDFSGGEATDLWLRAVDGGATIVASESDVLAIVESTDDEEEA
jgi:iron complex transport system ATP-binding protein